MKIWNLHEDDVLTYSVPKYSTRFHSSLWMRSNIKREVLYRVGGRPVDLGSPQRIRLLSPLMGMIRCVFTVSRRLFDRPSNGFGDRGGYSGVCTFVPFLNTNFLLCYWFFSQTLGKGNARVGNRVSNYPKYIYNKLWLLFCCPGVVPGTNLVIPRLQVKTGSPISKRECAQTQGRGIETHCYRDFWIFNTAIIPFMCIVACWIRAWARGCLSPYVSITRSWYTVGLSGSPHLACTCAGLWSQRANGSLVKGLKIIKEG